MNDWEWKNGHGEAEGEERAAINEPIRVFGWNDAWQERADAVTASAGKEWVPARVIAQYSHMYRVITNAGERYAVVTGRYEYEAADKGDFPAVGDWVMAELLQGDDRAVIRSLLPRRSAVSRKVAGGRMDEQIIGANIDYLFLVSSLNQDLNIRRIERYLTAVMNSGARPVIVLTKADLCPDPEQAAEQVRSVAPDGVPVVTVSAVTDEGRERLMPYLGTGTTVAAAGSSGAGKSTLLNWLSGTDRMRVQEIREHDARGKHTTTHRELFPVAGGALLMDTPGMRELQLWHADEGHEEAFGDIAALAARCRYRDCKHDREEGCAVQAAIRSGELAPGRYANYVKTGKELAHLARKERHEQRDKARRSGNGSRSGGRYAREAKRVRIWDEER